MTLMNNPEKPFELARFFSWISFLLILISSVVLALLIGNSTRSSLIEAQKEYVLLLSENLNKQLFRRFSLPVALASNNIALSDENQFRLLDETVESLLSGLVIHSVRILDNKNSVVYSLEKEEIRTKAFGSIESTMIFNSLIPYHFRITEKIPYVEAFFLPKIKESTFLLSIDYPLSIDTELAPWYTDQPILGVMQITVDISSHYALAIQNQRLILIIFFSSSLFLFVLLQFVARKAEKVIAERMERNRQLEIKLHQSEKLASMGRMVASIAHEIRNPLGIISSSAELLLSRTKDKLDIASYRVLNAMYDEACRLGVTVGDFLDYARPRQPKTNKVLLANCIRKALVFLEPKLKEENIEVSVDISENIIVYGEEELLYRAIYNLLVNAIQAMQETEEDKKIDLHAILQKDKSTELLICDTGPGFSDNNLKKALDPFYTTKDKGTGLGLPIVHTILESHGAILTLNNKPQKGACACIIFPTLENFPVIVNNTKDESSTTKQEHS